MRHLKLIIQTSCVPNHTTPFWQGQKREFGKENLLAIPLQGKPSLLHLDESVHTFSVVQHWHRTIAGCKTTVHDFSGPHWDHLCSLTGIIQRWNQTCVPLGMGSLSMTHICGTGAGCWLLHGTGVGKKVLPHHQNQLFFWTIAESRASPADKLVLCHI